MFRVCLSFMPLLIEAAIRLEPGVPLPHAEELERMIRANLFPNKKDDESFVEYFGNFLPDMDNDTLLQLENLDFSVLDKDGLRNIVNLVMQRDNVNATRRFVSKWEHGTPLYDVKGHHIANRTMLLMQQSIYATRYIIEKTKEIRKLYKDDLIFQLGIMYGDLLELRSKGANALSTMHWLFKAPMEWWTTKFSRFLWVYERILAIHVDVTNTVQRMFMLHAELRKATTVQATESTATTDDD